MTTQNVGHGANKDAWLFSESVELPPVLMEYDEERDLDVVNRLAAQGWRVVDRHAYPGGGFNYLLERAHKEQP